jgi:hypothetical protein
VAEVVGTGSWKDGSGGALIGGMTAVCGDNLGLLCVVQHGAMAASSVRYVAPLRGGIGGLHGMRAARPGLVRSTTLEVVHSAARSGSGFHDGGRTACGTVGISPSGVWCVSRSLLIAVVVVVGRGGCWWQTCSGLREHGRPWWMLAVGGRGLVVMD